MSTTQSADRRLDDLEHATTDPRLPARLRVALALQLDLREQWLNEQGGTDDALDDWNALESVLVLALANHNIGALTNLLAECAALYAGAR